MFIYFQLVFSHFPVFLIRDISSYIPACRTTITIGTGGVKVQAGGDKVRECFAGFNDHLLQQGTNLQLGKTSRKKLLFFWILSPQFGQLVQLFFNAKNVDLIDIQNDSLSKIPLKLRQNISFAGHVYSLKSSSKFKLLAFWRKQTP